MPVDSPLNPTNTTAAATTTTTTTAAAPISFTLTTAAAATTTPAAIARPPANQAPSRPVISSIPQTHHLHYPPQALYSAVRTPNHQLPKLHQDASHPILYPVASSGRGFVPRPIRPVLADQTVTVANPAGYPHRPVVSFSHRPIGSPHFDSMGHPMHLARPPNLQQQQLIPLSGSAILGSMKGTPNSSDPKVFPPSTICDSNGCKEMRVRDDALCVVRDRKVRITDGTSLYALCRSWLRNGSQEESQPQYGTFFRSLPRPLPIPVAGAVPSQKKDVVEEVDKEDKDEGSIEQLSTQEVLKRHVRRAKKVRSRLREERLQRIERYKTRLALLLPPPIEQLRSDSVTGS